MRQEVGGRKRERIREMDGVTYELAYHLLSTCFGMLRGYL